ncbi:hypothetical protein H6503_06370 [Candidatus Woesearchaeota archaeon]|nr:hypothetical protein [Candidatus Woesearchaeota archaeon]
MKHLEKTWYHARKNKGKTILAIVLDAIFLVIFLNLMLQYMPSISDNIIKYNDILDEIGPEKSLERLGDRAQDIIILEKELDMLFIELIGGIVLAFNVLLMLTMALLANDWSIRFIGKVLGINIAGQAILLLVFATMIDVKSALLGVFQQSSVSLFVFIAFIYIVYYFVWLFIISEKPIKFLRKSWFGYIWRYLIVNLLLVAFLMFTQVPLLIEGSLGLILMLAIVIIVFIPYITLSKAYLIEYIK